MERVKKGYRLGDVLVERGSLSLKDLSRAIQMQKEQEKKEQQQQSAANKDQEKKEEEKKGQGQPQNADQEEGNPGDPSQAMKAVRMTPQQAVQLLEAMKAEEKTLQFRPILRTNRTERMPLGDRRVVISPALPVISLASINREITPLVF